MKNRLVVWMLYGLAKCNMLTCSFMAKTKVQVSQYTGCFSLRAMCQFWRFFRKIFVLKITQLNYQNLKKFQSLSIFLKLYFWQRALKTYGSVIMDPFRRFRNQLSTGLTTQERHPKISQTPKAMLQIKPSHRLKNVQSASLNKRSCMSSLLESEEKNRLNSMSIDIALGP